MNILIGILKYPPDYTGSGFQTHNLYQRLKGKGVSNVYVITTSEHEYQQQVITLDGINIYYVCLNTYMEIERRDVIGYRIFKALFIIKKSFIALLLLSRLAGKIDIVHTVDSSWLSTAVSWGAFVFRKPLVREIVLIGTDDPVTIQKKKITLPLFMLPFNYAKLIIALSEPLKALCMLAGIPERKIWLKNPLVYLEAPDKGKLPAQILAQISQDVPIVLWVGSIEQRKNVLFLAQAAKYLEGNAQLVFVGPLTEAPYYEIVKKELEVAASVTCNRIQSTFVGRIDDRGALAWIYKKAKLFWFASFFEGLPNVVVESLVLGTPVVTLPVNDIMKDIILCPEDGEVVSSDDPKIFAHAVNKYLTSRNHDKNALQERSMKRFNQEEVEREYINRFRTMLGHANK